MATQMQLESFLAGNCMANRPGSCEAETIQESTKSKWKAEIVSISGRFKVLSLDLLSRPQIWNTEEEKDRKWEVGDRLAKLDEKKSVRELEQEIKNKTDEFRWKNNMKILYWRWENEKCQRSASWK